MPAGVGDILSVDISSWDMKGLGAGTAFDCNPSRCSGRSAPSCARDSATACSTTTTSSGGISMSSPELLLVNRVGSWALRPDGRHALREPQRSPRTFVQTMTDLACMEGANEAARVAVNAILAQEGVPADEHCPVWDAHESAALRPFQEVDRARYELGLPWSGSFEVGKWLVRGAHAAAAAADPLGPGDAEPATPGSGAQPRAEVGVG